MFQAMTVTTVEQTECYHETFQFLSEVYTITTTETDICGCLEWNAVVYHASGLAVLTMDFDTVEQEWVVTDQSNITYCTKASSPRIAAHRIFKTQVERV